MAKEKATTEAEPEPVGRQLIGLVRAATPDDLTAVENEIAAKERELAALTGVQKLLRVALGLEPAKKPGPWQHKKAQAATKAGTGCTSVSDERRQKCAKYILRNGATTAAALCRLFEIPSGSQTQTFEHDWFTGTDAGIDLTPKGREAARSLK